MRDGAVEQAFADEVFKPFLDKICKQMNEMGYLQMAAEGQGFPNPYFDAVTATRTAAFGWSAAMRPYVKTHVDINQGWGVNITALKDYNAWRPGLEEGVRLSSPLLSSPLLFSPLPSSLWSVGRAAVACITWQFYWQSSTGVRKFMGPTIMVADFSNEHGSTPMRETERASLSLCAE
jgi:hypothetical protein